MEVPMWDLNWLAVIGAALAGFVIGGLWYGPLFGKVWQREAGLSDADLQNANMPLIFGTTFFLNLLAAFILAHVLVTFGRPGLSLSVQIAGGIGLAFIATSVGVNYLFARKSVKLFLIDAGYWVVIYSVMGLVLSLAH